MNNLPSDEPEILPFAARDPGAADRAVQTLADLAALDIGAGGSVHVAEVDAYYNFAPGLVGTGNGWTVLPASEAGAGSWILASDSFSLRPLGDGADDWPRLMSAASAAAESGVPLEMEGGVWTCASNLSLPHGLDLVMNPETVVVSALTPDLTRPSVAPFLAKPGTILQTTSIFASNTFGSDEVVSADKIEAGAIVRIRDNVSGSGFHANSFTVQSVADRAEGGYVLRLDRPVQYDFHPGDVIDVLPVLPDIDIWGNGATVTGTGTRLLEFLATRDSVVADIKFVAVAGVEDLVASFDIGGFNNEFRRVHVDGAGFGFVGLALESQERSRVVDSYVTGTTGAGIMLYDNVDGLVWNTVAEGNMNGLSVSADGNVKGSLNTIVTGGRFSDNEKLGIGVHNGSTGTQIIGVEASGNWTNLWIGDAFSTVRETRISDSRFTGALDAAIRVIGSATGTWLGGNEVAESALGLDVQAGADLGWDRPDVDLGANAGVVLRGTELADRLAGTERDDWFVGTAGADTLIGGDGTDTLDYGAALGAVWIDLITAMGQWSDAEGDRLSGLENVVGGGFDDWLLGDDGANRLDGGEGDDLLEGRAGDDLLGGGDGGDRIEGGEGADTLIGDSGDDVLCGGLGEDVLSGGDGRDTADYGDAFGAVFIDLASGLGQWNWAHGDRLSGIENLIGTGWNDMLVGDAGDNRIDGGGGADHMAGGAGDDVYVVADAGDLVIEQPDAGTDEVRTSLAAYTLAANVERLTGTATDGQQLTGNSGNNVISGGDGDDVLDGQAGDDVFRPGFGSDMLIGGGGIDTVDFTGEFGAVWVDLAQGFGRWNSAHDSSLSGIENLIGTAWNDRLTGDAGANLLDGRAGADRLTGGAGDDVYIVDTVGDLVVEATDGGDDEVRTALASYTLGANVERLTGLAATGQRLAGNAAANVITAGEGDDVLDGGFGGDLLIGGAGRDTADYTGEFGAVWVDLAQGIGRWNAAHGDTLSGIENLIGTAWNDRLIGDAGDNVLDGGFGGDLLTGGDGIDTADYTGEFGAVWIDLAQGLGRWNAAHGDTLSGIENVIGTSWGDWLVGGAGDNVLTGGAGADRFWFAGPLGRDVVTDFSGAGGDGDQIRLDDFGVGDFEALAARMRQEGSDVLIDFGAQGSLLLQNVQLAALGASDFIFG